MFKKLLFFIFIFSSYSCFAQSDSHADMMQMRNGKVYFDNTYALNPDLKKEDLFKKALNWFDSSFPYPDKNISIADSTRGEIDGTGIFKIITSSSGHYYWIRFAINIIVQNATYELKVFDFYEKPIESGISNEYSKIEYRWRDFRKGKPWSAEDKILFKGLDEDINNMLLSLEEKMSK